jgi:tetratricopeptide (TPR) repeat protein
MTGSGGRGIRNKGYKYYCQKAISCVLYFLPCMILLIGCGGGKTVELPKAQREAVVLHQTANEAVEEGKYKVALKIMEDALILHRSIDDRTGEVIDLINIGRIFLGIGQYEEAEDRFNRALKIAISDKNDIMLSETYASIGKLNNLRGNYKQAIAALEKAIDIDRKIGHSMLGSRLNLIGIAFGKEGRYDEARGVLRKALKKNQENGLEMEVANSYRNFGDLFFEEKRYQGAKRYFIKALEIDKKRGDSRKIGADLKTLAEIEIIESNFKDAIPLLERAYKVHLNAGMPGLALENLDSLIATYKNLGDEGMVDIYQREKEGLIDMTEEDRDD